MPDAIDDIILDVAWKLAADWRDWVRDSISDAYPPPSEPHTPAHKRTGELAASLDYIVYQNGPQVVIELSASAPYAVYLEFGTEKMEERGFLGRSLDVWAQVYANRLQDRFPAQPYVITDPQQLRAIFPDVDFSNAA